MIPEYPKFKPLELSDLSTISKEISPVAAENVEVNPPYLFMWNDYDKYEFTTINGNLCIYASPPGESPYFLEPLGHNKVMETTEICIKHASNICLASEGFVSLLPKGAFKIIDLPDYYDYIYATKDIAELKGKKFDGKRNHIKKFLRKYPGYKYLPLTPHRFEEALKLFDTWSDTKKPSAAASPTVENLKLTSQKKALEICLKYFDKFDFVGCEMMFNEDLIGFSIGSRLTDEMIAIHFQYARRGYDGAYQTMLNEGCKKCFSRFKYINLECDLGMPGLRKTKLSYYPTRFIKKYQVEQYSAGPVACHPR